MEKSTCNFTPKKSTLSDFRFFWQTIAKKFEFVKIQIHDVKFKKYIMNNEKYTNKYYSNNNPKFIENIKKFVSKNLEKKNLVKQKYQINLNSINNDNFNILEITTDEIIITNIVWEFGSVKSIKDYSKSNRYFFAFNFHSDSYNFITGIMIYFNSDGLVSMKDKNIFSDTICSFHWSSCIVNYKLSSLYEQTLILGLVYAHGSLLRFELILLDHYDNILFKTHDEHRLQISIINNDYLYDNDYSLKKKYPRVLHIEGVILKGSYDPNRDRDRNNMKSIIFDLETLRYENVELKNLLYYKTNKENINIDYYVNQKILDEIEFCDTMKELNKKTNRRLF